MNTQQFLGLEFIYWTFICFIVAVIYFFVWPKPPLQMSRSKWQHIVLRYFHALVWLFLMLASLLRAIYDQRTMLITSDVLIYTALLTYLVFISTFLAEKFRRAKERT